MVSAANNVCLLVLLHLINKIQCSFHDYVYFHSTFSVFEFIFLSLSLCLSVPQCPSVCLTVPLSLTKYIRSHMNVFTNYMYLLLSGRVRKINVMANPMCFFVCSLSRSSLHFYMENKNLYYFRYIEFYFSI